MHTCVCGITIHSTNFFFVYHLCRNYNCEWTVLLVCNMPYHYLGIIWYH